MGRGQGRDQGLSASKVMAELRGGSSMSLRYTPSRSPPWGPQAGDTCPFPVAFAERLGRWVLPLPASRDGFPIAWAEPLLDKGLPPEAEVAPSKVRRC